MFNASVHKILAEKLNWNTNLSCTMPHRFHSKLWTWIRHHQMMGDSYRTMVDWPRSAPIRTKYESDQENCHCTQHHVARRCDSVPYWIYEFHDVCCNFHMVQHKSAMKSIQCTFNYLVNIFNWFCVDFCSDSNTQPSAHELSQSQSKQNKTEIVHFVCDESNYSVNQSMLCVQANLTREVAIVLSGNLHPNVVLENFRVCILWIHCQLVSRRNKTFQQKYNVFEKTANFRVIFIQLAQTFSTICHFQCNWCSAAN